MEQLIKEFDEKFHNLQMVIGYGEENDRIDATLIVRSFVLSSIQKERNEIVKETEKLKSSAIQDYINSTEGGDVPQNEMEKEIEWNNAISKVVEMIKNRN